MNTCGTWLYVIYKYLDLLMNLVMKYGRHRPHISRAYIFKYKWHHSIMIYTARHSKNCLFCIFFIYQDLMIPYVTIHKWVDFILNTVIDQNMNVRQWKIIFWVGFFEIPVRDAYSHLSIFFGDQNNIGQPCWVLLHFHQSRLDLFGYLFFNR